MWQLAFLFNILNAWIYRAIHYIPLCPSFCMCLCVYCASIYCVRSFMRVGTHAHTYMWRLTVDIKCFPQLTSSFILRRCLSENPEFINSCSLARQFSKRPSVSVSKIWDYRQTAMPPGFLCGADKLRYLSPQPLSLRLMFENLLWE